MKYLQVSWIHNFDDEPILLYHEMDDHGYEVRKIEIYKDGSFGIASSETDFGGTLLSPEPIPDVEEIRRDSQFIPRIISREEFEEEWHRHLAFLNAD